MMPDTEAMSELLNENAELKEQSHQHGKALARIGHWHTRKVSNPNAQARITEKETLETVLRIFKEEANR